MGGFTMVYILKYNNYSVEIQTGVFKTASEFR